MQNTSSSGAEKDILSVIATGKPKGRLLFGAFSIVAAVLLLLAKSQTEQGDQGWWNEPINAPVIGLGIMFVFSVLAAINAESSTEKWLTVGSATSIGLALGFLVAVLLITYIGYGLSVLCLCFYSGLIAGFRGVRLVKVSFGLTLLSLVVFRYILGLWFPKAALFELSPYLEMIGGYL